MSWNINELDKNKTEQSIANEQIRLDICREKLDKLIKERDRYKEKTDIKLAEFYEEIGTLKMSIDAGEQFVQECKEHLKNFD